MIWLRLFWEYFKTGLFAVGGGMATVPFLREMSARTGWFTAGKLADMIAVSESTPGPIGVNMATYVGYTVGVAEKGVAGGILGGVVATLGLVTPSFLVVMLVAAFLRRFRENRFVSGGLYGLRPASVGLIAAAGVGIVLFAVLGVGRIYDVGQAALDWRTLALAAAVLVGTRWIPKVKKLHPVVFVLLSALVGIALDMGG